MAHHPISPYLLRSPIATHSNLRHFLWKEDALNAYEDLSLEQLARPSAINLF